MKSGLLWFDDDPVRTLEDKVLRAAQRYEQKYGRLPTLCLVHPAALGDGGRPRKAGRVEIRAGRSVLSHHFWIGVADAPAQAGGRSQPRDRSAGLRQAQSSHSQRSLTAQVKAAQQPLMPVGYNRADRARQLVMEFEEARDGDE